MSFPGPSRSAGRRSARVAAAAAVLLAGAGPGAAAAQQYLYVASQEDVTVAVIDIQTKRLVRTVDLKALGYSETAKAHDTAVEPDGSFWYVSLIAPGKVLKFDRDDHLVGEADFETPGLLALDPLSDRLYVGRSMAATHPPERIGVIDRSTMRLEEIDVFYPRPHALAIDPVGHRFFSASLAENRIAYAKEGDEDVDLLDVPGPLHTLVQFAVSPDGHWLVAGGQISGDLVVFDLSGDAPTFARSLHVGGQPWHPVFTPDGASLWIPNQTANSVTVVDARSWSIEDVVKDPALAGPHGSAVSPDGRTVFVSSRNEQGTYHPADGSEGRPGTVVAIDVATHDVVAVIEVGRYAAGMSAPSGR